MFGIGWDVLQPKSNIIAPILFIPAKIRGSFVIFPSKTSMLKAICAISNVSLSGPTVQNTSLPLTVTLLKRTLSLNHIELQARQIRAQTLLIELYHFHFDILIIQAGRQVGNQASRQI